MRIALTLIAIVGSGLACASTGAGTVNYPTRASTSNYADLSADGMLLTGSREQADRCFATADQGVICPTTGTPIPMDAPTEKLASHPVGGPRAWPGQSGPECYSGARDIQCGVPQMPTTKSTATSVAEDSTP